MKEYDADLEAIQILAAIRARKRTAEENNALKKGDTGMSDVVISSYDDAMSV